MPGCLCASFSYHGATRIKNVKYEFSSQRLEIGGEEGQFAGGGDVWLYGRSIFKGFAVISSREMKEGKGIYHALSLPHALHDTLYLLTQHSKRETFSVLVVPPKG